MLVPMEESVGRCPGYGLEEQIVSGINDRCALADLLLPGQYVSGVLGEVSPQPQVEMALGLEPSPP